MLLILVGVLLFPLGLLCMLMVMSHLEDSLDDPDDPGSQPSTGTRVPVRPEPAAPVVPPAPA